MQPKNWKASKLGAYLVSVFISRKPQMIGLLSVLLVVLVVGLSDWLHPLPPRGLTLACGPEGSSYAVFGKRYQTLLAKEGVQLRLVTTAGGVENLALLRKPGSGIDIAFVDGGIDTQAEEPNLVSLGTLCYEPVWFFSRGVALDRGLFALRGKRVSVGPEGSDSRAIVNLLSKRKAMDVDSSRWLPLSPEESAAELLAGRIDAAVLVNSFASPLVRKLVRSEGINLVDLKRADAYAAMFPSLFKRVLPAGAVNIEKDRPSHDIALMATKTSLIVRKDLHPALQYLLLEIASKVHTRSGIFQKAGDFPSAEAMEIPLSPEATHYYKAGSPFLQRYMPFWLAALVEHAVVLLIPILGLAYPLVRGLMAFHAWRMQRKIITIYGELHWLESRINDLGNQPASAEILQDMDQLEDRARRVKVSLKFYPMLYNLKETLGLVRAKLDRRRLPRS